MTIDSTERLNLALAGGAVAASAALATPGFALSVAVGALLEAVNFRGLRGSAQIVFAGGASGRSAFAPGFLPRFMLLAVGIGVAIYVGLHPVGLLLGLSLIVPASIVQAWRSRPPVVESAPALAPDDPSWDRWNPWLARERDEEEEGEEA